MWQKYNSFSRFVPNVPLKMSEVGLGKWRNTLLLPCVGTILAELGKKIDGG
jgi:hypothetical protein